MAEKEQETKTQSVRISDELHTEIRLIAAERHVPISEVAQELLLDGVRAYRKKKN
jgi:hypothetical protein